MRLAVTMPFLALTIAAPCFAQEEEFNPYQAALDGMTLEVATPQLESLYGTLTDVTEQVGPDLAAAEGVLLYKNDPSKPVRFLFCGGKLAAFASIVSAAVAGRIVEGLTSPVQPATEIYASADGVMIRFPESLVSAQYWGIGTADSYVSVNYPWETIARQKFVERCQELATGG